MAQQRDLSAFSDLFNESVQPYLFEPIVGTLRRRTRSSEREMARLTQAQLGRVGRREEEVNTWCTCGRCQTMSTGLECLCCKEVPQIENWMMVNGCVTQHSFFQHFVLQYWNLFFCRGFHQLIQPSSLTFEDDNAKFRYTAYRNFVFAIWGKLPRGHRKVIPACVVTAIRAVYPSEDGQYVNFTVASPDFE